MPNRVIGAVGSYDFFAKSMPGIALLGGLSTLLPPGGVFVFEIESNFANFAAFVVTLVVVGLFFGEAVHTLAGQTELTLFSIGRWIIHEVYRPTWIWLEKTYSRLAGDPGGWGLDHLPQYNEVEPHESDDQSEVSAGETDKGSTIIHRLHWIVDLYYRITDWVMTEINRDLTNTSFLRRVFGGILAILPWFLNLLQRIWRETISKIRDIYWRLHFIFKQHRELFVHCIEWNYSHEHGPWGYQQRGALYDRFVRCFENEYQVDLKPGPEGNQESNVNQLYPLLTSSISHTGTTLSQRFQAIFSFCRSMWMASFLLFILYSYVIFIEPAEKVSLPHGTPYKPIGIDYLPEELPVYLIPIGLFFLIVIFQISVGKYKYHYVEYLMADFATTHEPIDEDDTE